MGLINDQAEIDSEFFVDADVGFGESITYKKRGTTSRTINATVDRDPPVRADTQGEAYKPQMDVQVRNDSTKGIALSELDTGLDRLSIAQRLGGTTKDFAFRLIEHDAGMLILEIT
jgi:hypothetical protein